MLLLFSQNKNKNMFYNKQDYTAISFAEQFYALTQKNLVYNYNFLYFSNKDDIEYKHRDAWVYHDSGSGGTITLSEEKCEITVGNSENSQMTFKQALHEFPRWQSQLCGQTVTAKAHMNISKDCTVKLSLTDGITISSKTITSSVQEDIIIDLQIEIDLTATELTIELECSNRAAIISISKIYANIGTIAIENLPCIVNGIIGERKQYIATPNPPAEELSLCAAAVELTSDYTRLNSVLNCRFGVGDNSMSMLPDVRGLFSRSWNNSKAEEPNDPDASTRVMIGDTQTKGDFVGTYEADIFEEHLHDLNFSVASSLSDAKGATGVTTTSTSQTENQGGAETRPKNFAELYTIKWA